MALAFTLSALTNRASGTFTTALAAIWIRTALPFSTIRLAWRLAEASTTGFVGGAILFRLAAAASVDANGVSDPNRAIDTSASAMMVLLAKAAPLCRTVLTAETVVGTEVVDALVLHTNLHLFAICVVVACGNVVAATAAATGNSSRKYHPPRYSLKLRGEFYFHENLHGPKKETAT
jgi:hypothetical protein